MKNYLSEGYFDSMKQHFRKMKTTFLLLTLFSSSLFAVNVRSQSTTLDFTLKNAKVRELIQMIENQTQYLFVYNQDEIDLDRKVDIDASNRNLDDVLSDVFSNTLITYKKLGTSIVLIRKGEVKQMDSISVSGTVTDENNNPLPGVNVVEKGTTHGTITDLNGKYTIEVKSANSVLQFSFVGYNTEDIPVADQKAINVSLVPMLSQLNEVVVVGYGTVKKADLTGAVGTVSAQDIVSKGTTSVMEGIQGKVAGVDITQTSVKPGAGLSIQIRGQNSLNSGEPLYVVDGIVTGDIDFLNPQDIAKIDILKDASSTAIYGSRGSNGVVLIQTKNAQNAGSAKLRVSYDGYYGIRQLARMPDFMDGREFAEYRAMCYLTFDQTAGKWELRDDQLVGPLAARNDGSGAYVVANKLYTQDYTDWLGLLTRTGHQQNHYLNMSGTSNQLTYNVGIGYQNEEGNFTQEYMDRYNLKVSVNHKPSEHFQMGAIANLSQTVYDLGYPNAYNEINKMAPYWNAYAPDGSIIAQPGADPALNSDRGQTGTLSPLAEVKAGKNERRRYDLLTSIYMEVSPIKGLTVRSTLAPRLYKSRTGIFNDIIKDTYYGTIPRPTREATSDNSTSIDYTWDNVLTYNTMIKDVHHITATGLFSTYSTRNERLKDRTKGMPYASDWYNMFSGEFDPSGSSSSYSETSLVSYMARLNYDFMGKYLLTASLRYDGSSKLAQKWASFPSVAVAWRASEESFLKASWLSNLKLRLSYGISGNNNGVSAFATQAGPDIGNTVLYNFGSDIWTGFAPGSPVNESLTWEKTREANLGLDFGFLNQRISGSVDVYDKLSDGLLMSRKLAIESGVASMQDNIGSVSNKGIEVMLNTINIRNSNFTWNTSFTFASNKNAIVSLYGRKKDVVGEQRFIGEPINVIYDYQVEGIWTQAEYDAGKTVFENHTAIPGEAHTLDTNGDGRLTVDDKVILGTPEPKWTGGMTSNLKYKNWDFSFNIITKQGMLIDDDFSHIYLDQNSRSTVKLASYDYYMPAGVKVIDWNNFKLDANGYATDIGWKTSTEENVNAKYPIYRNGNNGSFNGGTAYYKDPSFVKVKNIVLGYTFNENHFFNKAGISQFRIYTNVLNPFVFTKYEGYDPEYAISRVRDGNGPANVTYQFGVNLQF